MRHYAMDNSLTSCARGNSPTSRKVIFSLRTIERRTCSWRDTGTGNVVVYSVPFFLRSLNRSCPLGFAHFATLKTISSVSTVGRKCPPNGGQLSPYSLISIGLPYRTGILPVKCTRGDPARSYFEKTTSPAAAISAPRREGVAIHEAQYCQSAPLFRSESRTPSRSIRPSRAKISARGVKREKIMAEEREVRISLAQAKKFSFACDKCHAELVINIGSNKGHENMQTYEISRLPTSRSVMSFSS